MQATDRYLIDKVMTASPAQLVVMLYDRLLVDLSRAEVAVQAGDREASSKAINHAIDIVTELRATLNMDAWEHGTNLAQIYAYLIKELLGAQLQPEPAARIAFCRELVLPLHDAFRKASHQHIQLAV